LSDRGSSLKLSEIEVHLSVSRFREKLLGAFANIGVVAGLVVLLAMSWPLSAEEASFSPPEDAEGLSLAEAAKAEFRERMEPPPPYLAMLAIPERDRVASHVAYTLRRVDQQVSRRQVALSDDKSPPSRALWPAGRPDLCACRNRLSVKT
jgi:hypothetical protein